MLAKLLLPVLLLQPAWGRNPVLGRQSSQVLRAGLQRHVRNYEVTADSFLQALAKVASDFDIPMGIEWVPNRQTSKHFKMAWDNATVYDVIKSLTSTQPDYAIDLANGVVHVFPRNLAADPRNFLNLRVKRLNAQEQLFELVDLQLQGIVRQTVSPPPPAPPGTGVGMNIGSTPGEPLVSLQLENSTVAEALDLLSLKSSRKIWVVTFCDHCGLTPTGFYRTMALWRSTPLPDDLQPIWDNFKWREPIPSTAFNLK